MDAEGLQILLYPLSAGRPRRNRRRTDRRPASAARCADQGGRALHREDRDALGVLQRRRRTRHPGSADQLRREFRARRRGQALQPACDDRRRNGKILERNAGGALPVVHLLAGGRLGLSAPRLWHGAEGAQRAHSHPLSTASMKEYPIAPDLMDATASFARPEGLLRSGGRWLSSWRGRPAAALRTRRPPPGTAPRPLLRPH